MTSSINGREPAEENWEKLMWESKQAAQGYRPI